MAIAFPQDTYPLLQSAGKAPHDSRAMRDKADDGTPHIRFVNTIRSWAEIPLEFAPLDEITSQALIEYLHNNAATEFDLEYMGLTWRGYIWSDPDSIKEENHWWVTCSYYGRKV